MTDQLVTPLETPRLLLRPLVSDDTAALLPLFNDWRVIEWLSAPPWPYSRADMDGYFSALLASDAPDRELYYVIERDAGMIGGISWRMQSAGHTQVGSGPNIGYWLGAAHWGNGYMTEAANALIQHLFTKLPVNALYSGAFEGNNASLHVQDKLGFVRDGGSLLRSNPRNRDQPHINTVLHCPTYETWYRTPHAISRRG